MEALKDMFSISFYELLAKTIRANDTRFDTKAFLNELQANHDHASLNERMRNITHALHHHLGNDYATNVECLKRCIPKMPGGYTNLLFPDYVGQYGLAHKKISLEALAYFTQFGSSEFAIREFLLADFSGTIKEMTKWAANKNVHLRRLASEGSRPRLPWGKKLDIVIQQPDLTLPILERLKCDNELYVKKSVANHLNDFSKDNSEFMLNAISKWDLKNPDTYWICKHACRTLIKKGNKKAFQLFNFETKLAVSFKHFKIHAQSIKLGDSLSFSFELLSLKSSEQKLAIDYCIYYQKKGGQLSKKVFKLKECHIGPKQQLSFQKKQLFRDLTTRQHYKGRHAISIMVNGKEHDAIEFELK